MAKQFSVQEVIFLCQYMPNNKSITIMIHWCNFFINKYGVQHGAGMVPCPPGRAVIGGDCGRAANERRGGAAWRRGPGGAGGRAAGRQSGPSCHLVTTVNHPTTSTSSPEAHSAAENSPQSSSCIVRCAGSEQCPWSP